MRKILQVMPADGWRALYVSRAPGGAAALEAIPLVAWSLWEDEDGDRGISGLDSDAHGFTDYADEASNFVCYLSPGMDPEERRESAEARLEQSERRASEQA